MEIDNIRTSPKFHCRSTKSATLCSFFFLRHLAPNYACVALQVAEFISVMRHCMCQTVMSLPVQPFLGWFIFVLRFSRGGD
jgi:hypothetical protein